MRFKFGVVLSLFLAAACSPKYVKPDLATHFADPLSGLPDLDEKVVTPISGTDFTVIEFFASWCEACQKEAPAVGKLHEKYKTKGAQFYGVSIDFDPAESKEFVEANGIKYPILWDHIQEAQLRFDIEEVPATIVLDKAGKMIYRTQGAEQKSAQVLDKYLEGLTQKKAS